MSYGRPPTWWYFQGLSAQYHTHRWDRKRWRDLFPQLLKNYCAVLHPTLLLIYGQGVSGYTHLWARLYVKEMEWFDMFNKSKLLQSLVDMKTGIGKKRAKWRCWEGRQKGARPWGNGICVLILASGWEAGGLCKKDWTSLKSQQISFSFKFYLCLGFIWHKISWKASVHESILKTQPWEYGSYF